MLNYSSFLVHFHFPTFGSNEVIDAMAAGKQWQRAIQFLDEMRADGVPPNVISYGAAIKVCVTAGQWSQALNLLRTMRRDNIQPDVISYNYVIDGCAHTKNWYAVQHDLVLIKFQNSFSALPAQALRPAPARRDEGRGYPP